MIKRSRGPFSLFSLGLVLLACGPDTERTWILPPEAEESEPTDETPSKPGSDSAAPTVSFEAELYPITSSKCSGAGCHGPELGIGGVQPLLIGGPDPQSAASMAAERIDKIIERTADGSMPPPGSEALSTDEKAAFVEWQQGGLLP